MDFKPSVESLYNNLTLVHLPMTQSPSITALLMVKVGSRYETDKIAGISHFLEHMSGKGTEKYPTPMDLAVVLDSIGAEHNAFTSKEYTGFYVKASAQYLDLALKILSQIAFCLTLPEKEIEKEKGVIIEEINMREDMPMAHIWDEFESLVYGSTHLGREIVGTRESVRGLKRKDFVNFLNQWYLQKRMVLGVVGGFKGEKELGPLMKTYFKGMDNDPGKKPFDLKKLGFKQKKPQLRVKYKKTEQVHLSLGVRAFKHAHPDRYVMAVLATILGGNMSSRLFDEVRQKRGLAYYIKSDLNTYFDNGYLTSLAGVDINRVEETIKVILAQYGEMASFNSEGELKKAKEYLKGKLALSLEDSKDIASLFAEGLLLEDKLRGPKEIIAGIEKVSLADIKRVAKKIFVNRGLNLALIGPYKNGNKLEKVLKI